MIKGTTKSGIKYTIDERIKDNPKFLYYITKSQSKYADDLEKANDLFKFLELIFGDEKGLLNFMDAVAAAHDGVCTVDTLMSEFKEIAESIKLKN